MSDRRHILTPEASITVSFNIYQATIAIIAIFLGFTFNTLVTFLTSQGALAHFVVFGLVGGLLCFMTALLLIQLSAHHIYTETGIYFPRTLGNMVGALSLSFGILFMFFTISALLYDRGMTYGAIGVALYGFVLMSYFHITRSLLRRSGMELHELLQKPSEKDEQEDGRAV